MQNQNFQNLNLPYNTRYRHLKQQKQQNETQSIQKYFPYLLHQLIQSIYSCIEKDFYLHSMTPSFEQIRSIVFSNQEIYNLAHQIQSKINLYDVSTTISKDRKTSFFRTILKYLRIKANSKNDEITSQGDSEKYMRLDIIDRIQRKLNKNTISGEQIQELCNNWGQEIRMYLNSKKCVRDLLKVNKSKANKLYYMINLKEISIYAEYKMLHKYKFFKLQSLGTSIERMIGLFYNKKMKESEDSQMFTVNDFNIQFQNNKKLQE